jgi:hypothetical protein
MNGSRVHVMMWVWVTDEIWVSFVLVWMMRVKIKMLRGGMISRRRRSIVKWWKMRGDVIMMTMRRIWRVMIVSFCSVNTEIRVS